MDLLKILTIKLRRSRKMAGTCSLKKHFSVNKMNFKSFIFILVFTIPFFTGCNVPVQEHNDSEITISDFYFQDPLAAGAIDEMSRTILVTVPAGTDLSSLVPVIIHTGKSVSPGSHIAQNFSHPVTYIVFAADGRNQQYRVEVSTEKVDTVPVDTVPVDTVPVDTVPVDTVPVDTVPVDTVPVDTVPVDTVPVDTVPVDIGLLINSEKTITDFFLSEFGIRGYIDEQKKEIYVVIPKKTDMKSIKPVVTHTGKSISPDSSVSLDITNQEIYTVTASDNSQSHYTVIFEQSDIPLMFINTPDFIPIISKEVWIDGASYKIISDNNDLLNGSISIRCRGNSTFEMPKKSYNIKLPKGEGKPFLGMPSHRNWVLLANYSDKSLLRTDVAFKLGGTLDNLKWTPRSRFVVLYVNQHYQGVYQLVEQIRIDQNRVNISPAVSSSQPAGGYILEVDMRGGELFKFTYSSGLIFNCKDPDSKLEGVVEKIISNTQKVEDILYSESFADTMNGYCRYIDVKSFVDWYLVNEITKNTDAIFFSSVYMYYDPTDKKLYMGPLWDFDLAFGNVDYGSGGSPEGFYVKEAAWIARLFEDPAFVKSVKARWNEKKADIFTLLSYIDVRSEYLYRAQQINFKKWDILGMYVWPNAVVTGDYKSEVRYLQSWLNSRLQWLDVNINALQSD